jgi:transposase InsO family protein
MVSPSRRRAAVAHLRRRFRVSERRACRLVGQHRSTERYVAVAGDFELALVSRMNELAAKHPRYGYRMVWALLRGEGFQINKKRVERLWRLEGHRVPPRRSTRIKDARGGSQNAIWELASASPNDIWSYDFMSTRTDDGRPLRILNVVDEYTRVALGCRVARRLTAADVIVELEELFARHGKPRLLRSDNGREFTSARLSDWLAEQQVGQAFIERGSPQQNAYVERFNGTMRDEKLNGETFHSVLEARVVLAEWIEEYNTVRPHRGHGMRTPAAFAEATRVGSS